MGYLIKWFDGFMSNIEILYLMAGNKIRTNRTCVQVGT